jgi:hypothetical protein
MAFRISLQWHMGSKERGSVCVYLVRIEKDWGGMALRVNGPFWCGLRLAFMYIPFFFLS